MKKAVVGIAFLVSSYTAVWAEEFYIVRDLATQKCTVVNKRPVTNTRTITLATDTIFKIRADAEAGVKSIKVCTGQK